MRVHLTQIKDTLVALRVHPESRERVPMPREAAEAAPGVFRASGMMRVSRARLMYANREERELMGPNGMCLSVGSEVA